MGLFKKHPDPIHSRSKALNAQIASLEAEIKKLDQKLQSETPKPRPPPALPPRRLDPPRPNQRAPKREPVFEEVGRRRLETVAAPEEGAAHFNDLGVRKYDLAAAWRRWRSSFRGAPASNPKLVTYLAAGSIRGLRPLRYEKRVARNRFIVLSLVLVSLLWGIIWAFVRSR